MGSRLITIFIGRRYLVNSSGGGGVSREWYLREGEAIRLQLSKYAQEVFSSLSASSSSFSFPHFQFLFVLQVDSQLMRMNMQM